MQVVEKLTVVDREVQDREGRWYSLRIRPYRTRESRIDGVVLVLLDIDEIKRAIKNIITLTREPLLTLGADLKVIRANDAFAAPSASIPTISKTNPFTKWPTANGTFHVSNNCSRNTCPPRANSAISVSNTSSRKSANANS
jgi:two-component system CheB/CheR fusion protein